MIKRNVVSGYSTVTMYYDRALREMPYAQAGVNVADDGAVVLVSYTTPVIYINAEGWLTCTGTYSRTTAMHINRFLKEYAPKMDYHLAKWCYNNDQQMNIYTGEIRPLI